MEALCDRGIATCFPMTVVVAGIAGAKYPLDIAAGYQCGISVHFLTIVHRRGYLCNMYTSGSASDAAALITTIFLCKLFDADCPQFVSTLCLTFAHKHITAEQGVMTSETWALSSTQLSSLKSVCFALREAHMPSAVVQQRFKYQLSDKSVQRTVKQYTVQNTERHCPLTAICHIIAIA